jgi:flagellar motility protein MotE (MotC chaperone)
MSARSGLGGTMRSSASSARPGTASSTRRPGTAGSAARKGTGAAVATAKAADERDDYVTNLKGQIYLLSVENEMLKKETADSHAHDTMTVMAPSADLPVELGDAFELMRRKYASLDARYHSDLAEVKRAAEALSTQCAAQSSLITTLKKEAAGAQDVIAHQKAAFNGAREQAMRDVAHLQHDIQHLEERIGQLQKHIEGNEAVMQQQTAQTSGLKAGLDTETAARVAADAARARTLDAYARMTTAVRVVTKNWRFERAARMATVATAETVRARGLRRGGGLPWCNSGYHVHSARAPLY